MEIVFLWRRIVTDNGPDSGTILPYQSFKIYSADWTVGGINFDYRLYSVIAQYTKILIIYRIISLYAPRRYLKTYEHLCNIYGIQPPWEPPASTLFCVFFHLDVA